MLLCCCPLRQDCQYGLDPFFTQNHDSGDLLCQRPCSSIVAHWSLTRLITCCFKLSSHWTKCRQTPLFQSVHTGGDPCSDWQRGWSGNAFEVSTYQGAQYPKVKKGESHWILDSPLASKSLRGTAERDTVRGSLWRPAERMTTTLVTIVRWSTTLQN